ncbi:MAG: MarR family transcriptional regulator [Candidatus Diapherotrites archaeon]|uniref:MarR family transcriptional regulator n=1 Tax=Candidatus Iainarchaeum sp. TaxID=3101447 RepID=A0A8T3YL61_9ARCH|nr:MarR family transcriptional regulator [Candidatus Diapherotrites archaeon]
MTLLQEIFGSKSKIGLLAKVIDSEESFSVRELARLSGLPKSTVSLIADEWQKAGLLSGQTIGKARVLRINPRFPLYKAVSRIFAENQFGQQTV